MNEYYHNIEVCPLNVFRAVMVKSDYKQLHLSGQYNEEKAKEVWMGLYDEYNDIIKTNKVDIFLELGKQIKQLQIDYTIINHCLYVINEAYKTNLINSSEVVDLDFFIKTINEYGYRFDISKGVSEEIIRVKKQANNINSQIKSKQKQLETIGEETGSWTFDDTIGMVEKYMGYPMPDNIKVIKFTTYMKQLINSNKKADNGK